MKRLHLTILVSLLILSSFGLFLYKTLILKYPVIPDQKSYLWNIEARLLFRIDNQPAKVSLLLPKSSRYAALMDENFISLGAGLTMTVEGTNRKASWAIRKGSGQQDLFYRAIVRYMETNADSSSGSTKNFEITPADYEGAKLAAALAILKQPSFELNKQNIEQFVLHIMQQIFREDPDENARILLGKKPSTLKKLETVSKILALGNVGSRLVHGIRLEERQNDAPIIHWLEVVDPLKAEWLTFEPYAKSSGLSKDALAWWRGNYGIYESEGTENLRVRLSVNRNVESAIKQIVSAGESSHAWLFDYSLFSLPIETQAVYAVILLIPIGALLVVILRNVVGIKTFGTFMPVLVAVAFRETELLWGIVFLCLVIAIGLLVRFYLAKLRLLLVPRLAAVLSIVVILMAAISIITHRWGIERGLSIALFPMVIMTMMIERMTIVWDEQGALEAVKQGLGSIFAASMTYLIITNKFLEYLVFVFPEMLLVVIAINLLIGRYTGYRLTELKRFNSFLANDKT